MSDIVDKETEELLEKLGAVKSNYGLIKLASNQIRNKLLLADENPNDNPASFMNIFLENFGRMGSLSFYEQMMYKNEMNVSTAIKLRSLMNKMNQDMVAGIYAHPSDMTFVLGYEYDEIIKAAKETNNKLVLNKDTKFSISGQLPFTLDHNVNIIVTNSGQENQNIYAIFDTSDKLNPNSKLSNVNNIFIPSQVYRYENKNIFALFLPTRQMYRKEKIINVTNNIFDFKTKYDEQLFGFEVHYMGLKDDKYTFLDGSPDGVISVNGYNFSIDIDDKIIYISFNRNPNYFYPKPGDKIKIIVYTTEGIAGNFAIADIYNQYENIKFEYSQERNLMDQEKLTNLKPYVSIRDGIAKNGKDMKTFEEIRTMVLNRGSHSSILTPGDLEKVAQEKGFTVNKIRNDIRCLEYRACGVLQQSNDIISSINTTLYFDFDDIPINKEVNNRTITPKFIFERNKDSDGCRFVKKRENYNDYYMKYRLEEKNQFMFPYHIKFTASNSLIAEIYNMNIKNKLFMTDFLYFNKFTSNESSIISLSLNRDPLNESIDNLPGGDANNPNSTGYFEFSFIVSTSSNVIDNLLSNPESPIMKYRLMLKDRENGNVFATECVIDSIDQEKLILNISAYVKTNDAISNLNKLCCRDYSLYPIPMTSQPIEYYFIGGNVDVRIYAIEKNLNGDVISTPYDEILFRTEKDIGYFVSTVYKVDDISLFENYNDYINISSDVIISQPTYEYYENDVLEIYPENVFAMDDNGEVLMEDTTVLINGVGTVIQKAVVVHNKGDVVYNDDGTPVIKYRKGTVKRDKLDNYVYKTKEKYTGVLKNTPVYDRIHSLGNGFFNTINTYENLIANIKSLNTLAPDGANITMGIKNTAGPGEYEIYNMASSTWEPIDNIALSFDLGVKYKDNANNDVSIDNRIISDKIRDYINSFSGISFGIDSIFDMIKTNLPSIEYMIIYKINQYPANRVQAIRKKNGQSFVSDKLSVKQIVDTGKTDLSSMEVVFKSDITIRVID